LRRRRAILRYAALCGLALFLASFPLAKALQSDKALYAGLLVFLLAQIWGSLPLFDFRCPHCGETFVHDGRWRRNAFARRCVHCGCGPGVPGRPAGPERDTRGSGRG
jgi:hypothetical protein